MSGKLKWKVLVLPGGTEVGLEIYRSLSGCKEVELLSAASDTPNHAPFVFKKHFVLPDVRHPDFLKSLIGLVATEKCDFIFPANPIVIDRLVELREKIPCPLVLADSKLVKLCRSKKATLKTLEGAVSTPQVYENPKGAIFPIFFKPDSSYGGLGSFLLKSPADLDRFTSESRESGIFQEYLPGREFTVDCFSGANGKLLFSKARERIRIRMGTSLHAEPLDQKFQKEIRICADKIAEKIPLTGAWFFQMKEGAKGDLKVLEVEARLAGTMCYHRVQGVNFALLWLYQLSNPKQTLEIMELEIPHLKLDRMLSNRYLSEVSYRTVYIDLDDTVLVRGGTNPLVIQFLYQCINRKVKLVLLSKCKEPELLKKHRLSEIFDEVIWLNEEDRKADYIQDSNSIFIDDSFSQRKDVWLTRKIPTLDPSMIEVLIDDRV